MKVKKKTPDITSRHHPDWEIHRQVFQCQENTAPGIQKALWYQALTLWSWALLDFWQALLAPVRISQSTQHILYFPGPHMLLLQNNCCLSAFSQWGKSFSWIKALYFLSAACTPLHHPSFPRGSWLSCMLQKVAAQQHWEKRNNKCNTNGDREENRETPPSAPTVRASCLPSPKHRGWAMCSAGQPTSTNPEWDHGHCCGVGLCLPACVHPVLCRIRSAWQNPSLTNSSVSLKLLLKVMEECQACRHFLMR